MTTKQICGTYEICSLRKKCIGGQGMIRNKAIRGHNKPIPCNSYDPRPIRGRPVAKFEYTIGEQEIK